MTDTYSIAYNLEIKHLCIHFMVLRRKCKTTSAK